MSGEEIPETSEPLTGAAGAGGECSFDQPVLRRRIVRPRSVSAGRKSLAELTRLLDLGLIEGAYTTVATQVELDRALAERRPQIFCFSEDAKRFKVVLDERPWLLETIVISGTAVCMFDGVRTMIGCGESKIYCRGGMLSLTLYERSNGHLFGSGRVKARDDAKLTIEHPRTVTLLSGRAQAEVAAGLVHLLDESSLSYISGPEALAVLIDPLTFVRDAGNEARIIRVAPEGSPQAIDHAAETVLVADTRLHPHCRWNRSEERYEAHGLDWRLATEAL